MRGSRLGRGVAVAALVLLAAVGAVEVVLRVTGAGTPEQGGYPRGLYVPAPGVGYALAPGFEGEMELDGRSLPIRINAHGYRDDPFGEPEPGTLRVLALGDSFGFGHAVAAEDAYPEVLERLLGAGGAAVEVLNLGVPGYDPLLQLAQLEREGAALAPDLVLLGCYVGNDPSGVYDAQESGMTARLGYMVRVEPGTPDWLVTARAALNAHSRLWRLVRQRRRGAALATLERSPEELRRAACEHALWSSGVALELFRRPPTDRSAEALELASAALAAIARHCDDVLGVPLVVALLPAPHQYHAPTWHTIVAECGLDPGEWDLDLPNRVLLEAVESAGHAALDLTPAFRAASERDPDRPLFLDVHFDERGHRLAAEQIASFLAERGLVP